MVPARVEAKLLVLFAGNELKQALRILPQRPPEFGELGYEQLLMSITKLSEGRLERLKYFAARAEDYPDDVVKWGQLREVRSTLKPRSKVQRIERASGLQGGPITLPDVAPNPLADDEDLWEGLGVGKAFLCSVCRREYGSFDPEIWLYRRDEGSGLSAQRIHVHPRCVQAGETLALSQGYGWHQGQWPGSKD
jgi:hypothetical protein